MARVQSWKNLVAVCGIAASAFLWSATAFAQASKPSVTENPAAELNKYPGLLQELGQLLQKMQIGVQSPQPRSQSRLLPLLPASTVYYVALPNYGSAAQQTLDIFHQELATDSNLNKWWHGRDMADQGKKIEDAIGKFTQLSQFLGDEVVISGTPDTPDRAILLVAEVRKPGLKEFIEQNLVGLVSGPASVRVFDEQTLASATDTSKKKQQLSVLVRPDFVVAAASVQALRDFNRSLGEKGGQFGATPFGQRLTASYRDGASVLAGVNIEALLRQMPPAMAAQRQILQSTGFADAKYLVWEHKNVAGQANSQAELSFNGPRRGVASWLAPPIPPRGLDFVSPHALFAGTFVLKNLADVFADIQTLTAAQNPNQRASLDQMQQVLHLDLKKDLLHHFDGEITLAVESAQPEPAWMAAARVNDPAGLQQTLSKLMMTMPVAPEDSEENGVHYHVLRIPAGPKPTEIAYTFVDGYLLVASSRDIAAAAIARRQSGDSLANLPKFQPAIPPGHPEGVSALLYEDPIAAAALSVGRTSPEMADMFSQMRGKSSPVVICAYGAPNAIREASMNGGADAGVILVVGAVAIPNLLRARISANEASAASILRTVNTAEVSYTVSYPQKGYARDLATLGPDPRGPNFTSFRHAGLIDQALGSSVKDGYSFSIRAVCDAAKCTDYVVLARPLSNSTGSRFFCSTSDAVIRVKTGMAITGPLSVAECRRWTPLN